VSLAGAPKARAVSVIVPVFRSSTMLRELHARLSAALVPLCARHEIVLVEDAGGDDAWSVIEALAAADSHVRGIRLSRNYGQHNALLCGIRAARYEIVVTLDDDLQNPPEEIGKLLDRLDEGFDVVYGAPEREQHGLWRNMASRATKFVLQNAMGASTARRVSAFRACRTHLRGAFARFHGPYVSIDVLLTWGAARFSYVVVRHDPRAMGTSNYTLRKLVTHALNLVTGFSTGPLQLAGLVGLVFAILGILAFLYVLVNFLVRGGVVPGFAFLASMIAIFAGAQLFALGIIGEYLARMHFRTMDRPPYLVRDETGDGSSAHGETRAQP